MDLRIKKANSFKVGLFYLLAMAAVGLTLFFQVTAKIGSFNALITIFLSILLEALPFILIGTLLSSVIEVFFPKSFLQRIIPSNRLLSLPAASLAGFLFPICECGIVPVASRLIKKGVPAHVAITFLLSVPISNPVVLLSTYYAFGGDWRFVGMRFAGGVVISIIAGFIISLLVASGEEVLKEEHEEGHGHHGEHGHGGHSCGCGCGHDHGTGGEHHHGEELKGFPLFKKRVKAVIDHTTEEFFDVGKFMIAGALLSSLFQTFVPRNIIAGIGKTRVLSVILMMIFAFTLSVCSESDAFIARTFLSNFSVGSILSFMVFGPMLDIKNSLMLMSKFKSRFVVLLIILVVGLNLIFALAVNLFMPFI